MFSAPLRPLDPGMGSPAFEFPTSLLQHLADINEDVRRAAVTQLSTEVSRAEARKLAKVAPDIALLLQQKDEKVREAAVSSMGFLSSSVLAGYVPLIVRCLEDPNADVRDAAVRTLRAAPVVALAKVVPAMQAQLATAEWCARPAIAAALATLLPNSAGRTSPITTGHVRQTAATWLQPSPALSLVPRQERELALASVKKRLDFTADEDMPLASLTSVGDASAGRGSSENRPHEFDTVTEDVVGQTPVALARRQAEELLAQRVLAREARADEHRGKTGLGVERVSGQHGAAGWKLFPSHMDPVDELQQRARRLQSAATSHFAGDEELGWVVWLHGIEAELSSFSSRAFDLGRRTLSMAQELVGVHAEKSGERSAERRREGAAQRLRLDDTCTLQVLVERGARRAVLCAQARDHAATLRQPDPELLSC